MKDNICERIGLSQREAQINHHKFYRFDYALMSLTATFVFTDTSSFTSVTKPITLATKECMSDQNDQTRIHFFPLLLMDVNFTYWSLLQFLLIPKAFFKNGVCKIHVIVCLKS